MTISGFAVSVIVGGMSSAYSFSKDSTKSVTVTALSSRWFYAMAGGLVIAMVFLHAITPVDYKILLRKKIERRKVS